MVAQVASEKGDIKVENVLEVATLRDIINHRMYSYTDCLSSSEGSGQAEKPGETLTCRSFLAVSITLQRYTPTYIYTVTTKADCALNIDDLLGRALT